jgi:hypothetical protein
VLIDHSMRIYLLETNNGPSLNLDEESDRAVKLGVVTSALEMVKTHYRQPPSRPPDKRSPVSEEEVLDLRQVPPPPGTNWTHLVPPLVLPTHLSHAPCHVPPTFGRRHVATSAPSPHAPSSAHAQNTHPAPAPC